MMILRSATAGAVIPMWLSFFLDVAASVLMPGANATAALRQLRLTQRPLHGAEHFIEPRQRGHLIPKAAIP